MDSQARLTLNPGPPLPSHPLGSSLIPQHPCSLLASTVSPATIPFWPHPKMAEPPLTVPTVSPASSMKPSHCSSPHYAASPLSS